MSDNPAKDTHAYQNKTAVCSCVSVPPCGLAQLVDKTITPLSTLLVVVWLPS